MDKSTQKKYAFEYRAGICNHRKPILYNGIKRQESIANIAVSVGILDTENRIPISKITQKVIEFEGILQTPWSLQMLIDSIYAIHKSTITIDVRIPLSFIRSSLCSHIDTYIIYDCIFSLSLYKEELIANLCCTLPLVTVCSCSLKNSAPRAHMQRIETTFCLNSDASLFLEDILPVVEASASEKTYPIIKQIDEKAILSNAYSKACLVEDVIYHMASSLHNHASIEGFKIFVQSFESLHPHDIIGYVEHNYKSLWSPQIQQSMKY